MRAEPFGIRELVHHPIMQFMKTCFRIVVWDSPFGGMLLVLQYGVSNAEHIKGFHPPYNPG